MKMRIGVDIGGTFTDCVVIDEKSAIHTFKEVSTPKDHSIGLYNVIHKAAEYFNKSLTELLGGRDDRGHCHKTHVSYSSFRAGSRHGRGDVFRRSSRSAQHYPHGYGRDVL